jgi:hypothetical protein
MLIRMLVGLSGSAYSLSPGDERDFPQGEALRIVAAGFAIPVEEKSIERAVDAPIVERRGRKHNVVSGQNNGGGNR